MSLVLALDAGTTSCRALVFDDGGRVLALAQREFAQSYPRPGFVEHDAEEIWQVQAAVADEALRRAGIGTSALAGIGITNQRETTVIWERQTGRPVAPAIVWQDRRTASECARLRAEGREALIRRRTGLLLDPYFSALKIAWILDHAPGARAAAERGELAFGTIDSFLTWKLTEGALHATDPSNASRTMLYDLERGDWDRDLLDLFGIPAAILPRIAPSSGILGEVRAPMIARGVPIAALIGDQQAASMGQLILAPGLAKCTYGTGCFLLMNAGSAPPRDGGGRLLRTVLWERRGRRDFAFEGSVFVGGAAVQWLRDGLGIIADSSEVVGLAASVPDSGGLVFVPALAGLGAPHWDPEARGLILGITRGSTAAHLARATLEGIAFQVADLVTAMNAESGLALRELRVDGGAAANDLLMQFQADVLRVPVLRPRQIETTALGAAFLAGLATGVWSGPEELESTWQLEERFEPLMPESQARARRARWQDAVARARAFGDPDW